MALIPIRFHDWWDDCSIDSSLDPFRSSRLLDQHFGLGLHRNDLLSSLWGPSRPMGRTASGYLRPWVNEAMRQADSGSTLNLNKDKFEMILDVQQFKPNEISVKTTDKEITVEAKHKEKIDEHGQVFRHFIRRYALPKNVKAEEISSTLSSDGVLTIKAPLKQPLPVKDTARDVPIEQVAAAKRVKGAKKDTETTS